MMKIIIDENKWNILSKDAQEEGVYIADLLLALHLEGYVFDIVADNNEISNELSYFDEKLKEYQRLSEKQKKVKKGIQDKYRFRNLREKRAEHIKEGIVKENMGYSKIKKTKTGKITKDKVESLNKNAHIKGVKALRKSNRVNEVL